MSVLPNFFLIGSEKAGTTSLYSYLRQHPDVFMPERKEPGFFAMLDEPPFDFKGPGDEVILRQRVTNWEEYRELFRSAGARRAVGEASTIYLYHPRVPERLERYAPGARYIAVLRDPIERAYSHWLMMRRFGREKERDFVAAVRAEDKRTGLGWGMGWRYASKGFYAEQLERYFKAAGRDRVRVYLTEDLDLEPLKVTRDIFAFLRIDESFKPDCSKRFNRTPAFAWPWEPRPRPSASQRKALAELFRPPIERLERLLGRDLTAWRRAL